MAISVRASSCTSDPVHPCRVQQLGTTPQAAEDRFSLQAGAGRKCASLHSLHDIELNSQNKWQFPSGLAHAPRIQSTRVGYNSLERRHKQQKTGSPCKRAPGESALPCTPYMT